MGLAIHEALILFGLDRETGAWHSTRLDMGVASAVTESPDPFVHMLLSVADATGLLPQILDVEILLNQEPQADELPPQDSPADTSTDQFTDQLFHTTLRMEDERALAALERTKMNLYGGLA